MRTPTFKTREDGLTEIHNPSIDHVKIGMMVRTRQNRGIIVDDVDKHNQQVLVHSSIGGTKENRKWYPIEQIKVVWSIGTYAEAMKKIKEFDRAIYKLAERG